MFADYFRHLGILKSDWSLRAYPKGNVEAPPSPYPV